MGYCHNHKIICYTSGNKQEPKQKDPGLQEICLRGLYVFIFSLCILTEDPIYSYFVKKINILKFICTYFIDYDIHYKQLWELIVQSL